MNEKITFYIYLGSMVGATVLWYAGDILYLREAMSGKWWLGLRWLGLNLISVPLYAFSTYGLFATKRTWWIVEFPYWIISILLSLILFRRVLGVSISWRELLSGGLMLIIVILLGYEN